MRKTVTCIRDAGGDPMTGARPITEIEGDLFDAPADEALAHCVSADCAMGAGIALQFARRYPMIRSALRAQTPTVGQALPFTGPDARKIFNLVTKTRYWEKPTYDTLRASLVDLRGRAQALSVGRIAMPRIGSGLDRLAWPRVRAILGEVFADSGIGVTVYVLQSASRDAP